MNDPQNEVCSCGLPLRYAQAGFSILASIILLATVVNAAIIDETPPQFQDDIPPLHNQSSDITGLVYNVYYACRQEQTDKSKIGRLVQSCQPGFNYTITELKGYIIVTPNERGKCPSDIPRLQGSCSDPKNPDPKVSCWLGKAPPGTIYYTVPRQDGIVPKQDPQKIDCSLGIAAARLAGLKKTLDAAVSEDRLPILTNAGVIDPATQSAVTHAFTEIDETEQQVEESKVEIEKIEKFVSVCGSGPVCDSQEAELERLAQQQQIKQERLDFLHDNQQRLLAGEPPSGRFVPSSADNLPSRIDFARAESTFPAPPIDTRAETIQESRSGLAGIYDGAKNVAQKTATAIKDTVQKTATAIAEYDWGKLYGQGSGEPISLTPFTYTPPKDTFQKTETAVDPEDARIREVARSSYTGNSILDFCKRLGYTDCASSGADRAKIVQAAGIENYNPARDNPKVLANLRTAPATPTVPAAPVASSDTVVDLSDGAPPKTYAGGVPIPQLRPGGETVTTDGAAAQPSFRAAQDEGIDHVGIAPNPNTLSENELENLPPEVRLQAEEQCKRGLCEYVRQISKSNLDNQGKATALIKLSITAESKKCSPTSWNDCADAVGLNPLGGYKNNYAAREQMARAVGAFDMCPGQFGSYEFGACSQKLIKNITTTGYATDQLRVRTLDVTDTDIPILSKLDSSPVMQENELKIPSFAEGATLNDFDTYFKGLTRGETEQTVYNVTGNVCSYVSASDDHSCSYFKNLQADQNGILTREQLPISLRQAVDGDAPLVYGRGEKVDFLTQDATTKPSSQTTQGKIESTDLAPPYDQARVNTATTNRLQGLADFTQRTTYLENSRTTQQIGDLLRDVGRTDTEVSTYVKQLVSTGAWGTETQADMDAYLQDNYDDMYKFAQQDRIRKAEIASLNDLATYAAAQAEQRARANKAASERLYAQAGSYSLENIDTKLQTLQTIPGVGPTDASDYKSQLTSYIQDMKTEGRTQADIYEYLSGVDKQLSEDITARQIIRGNAAYAQRVQEQGMDTYIRQSPTVAGIEHAMLVSGQSDAQISTYVDTLASDGRKNSKTAAEADSYLKYNYQTTLKFMDQQIASGQSTLGAPLPASNGVISLHPEEVDVHVKGTFERARENSQAQIAYAQDLLARSANPPQEMIARTLLSESQDRLRAIDQNYALYQAGNPNPDLQQVIERMKQGQTESGALSEAFSSFSNKANTDADTIGAAIQTDNISNPLEFGKVLWDGSSWALAKTAGVIAESSQNLLGKIGFLGFAPSAEQELIDAIDPYGNEWRTLTDVGVMTPIGVGMWKLGSGLAFPGTNIVVSRPSAVIGASPRSTTGISTRIEPPSLLTPQPSIVPPIRPHSVSPIGVPFRAESITVRPPLSTSLPTDGSRTLFLSADGTSRVYFDPRLTGTQWRSVDTGRIAKAPVLGAEPIGSAPPLPINFSRVSANTPQFPTDPALSRTEAVTQWLNDIRISAPQVSSPPVNPDILRLERSVDYFRSLR